MGRKQNTLVKKNLSQQQKLCMVIKILSKIDILSGSFPAGLNELLEREYNCCRVTIHNIWKQFKIQNSANFSDDLLLKPKKKSRLSSTCTFNEEIASAIDFILRESHGNITIRGMKVELEKENLIFSYSTVFQYLTAMGVVQEKSYVKPYLSEKHKMHRLLYVLSMIDTSDTTNLTYLDHTNRVHIDEKWFYMIPVHRNIMRLPDHPIEYFSTIHKSHIPKVMITAAFSEPTPSFDGKVGIYVHGEMVPAARSSINRLKGTMELKPKNIDAAEFYESQTKEGGLLEMIAKVKLPDQSTTVQMDNAPPHIGHHNIDLLNQYCIDHHMDISYVTQPAQSPDFQICDLALFNSLQKKVDHLKAEDDHTLLALWNATLAVFVNYPKRTISICFGHLYSNFNECLRYNGGNNYPSPHAEVRKNFSKGLPLNKCIYSMQEYTQKKIEVMQWLNSNE